MKVTSTPHLVVFDLGGVMVNLDMKATLSAFASIGIMGLEKYVNQSQALGDVFERFGRGLATEKEFYDEVRRLSALSPTDEQICDAWNTMVVDFPVENVHLVERLKKDHRVVLLSNTNILHQRKFDSFAEGYSSLSDLFHHTYYSHEMHLAKPDPEIFRQMLAAENVRPADAVFFDDSQANIDAARSVGMHACLVTAEKPVTSFFLEE